MKKNTKLVLLDLDGVIVNTKVNMQMAWSKVQKNFDLEIPFNEYFKNIGLPFKVILKKISIKKNLTKIEKVYREESIKQFNKIKLYSEIHKTLRKLKKKQIIVGVVTSKDRIRTIKLIKKFKINIKLIVTPSKKLRGKPFPDQLLKAIKIAKLNRINTIYVGDMLVDYKAAKNAKINFVHAKYGYGKKYIYYKRSIKKFKDLLKII